MSSRLPSPKKPTSSRAKIAFISGPSDASPRYFAEHYIPRLNQAIAAGHHFVLGPSSGVDSLALSYLLSGRRRVAIERIRAYVIRNQASQRHPALADFKRRGGIVVAVGKNPEGRNAACTRASHYDILRYRTQEEMRVLYGSTERQRISEAEKNEIRRREGSGLVWVEDGDEIEERAAVVVEEKVDPVRDRLRNMEKIAGALQKKGQDA